MQIITYTMYNLNFPQLIVMRERKRKREREGEREREREQHTFQLGQDEDQ